jgi:hypothetical protein
VDFQAGSQLTIALLLPWCAGYLLATRILKAYGRLDYGILTRLGYGFLLGQILVGSLLVSMDGLGLGIGFYPVIAALSLLMAITLWPPRPIRGLALPLNDPPPEILRPSPPLNRIERAIAIALGLLILAHWGIAAFEVWWRPLYPWDAWTLWSYRASVWFQQGELVPFLPAAEWVQATEAAYTVDGYHYPTLVSLLQTWIALALGQWHESLINLPWLLVPIALACILYDQLRVIGSSVTLALLAVYALFSMPMFLTHFALAGYADIWQAAYISAGLMALVVGVRLEDRLWQLWGLIFAVFGIWVKQEGAIWLFLFGLITILPRLDRRILIALAGLLPLFVLLVVYQVDLLVELPYLGPIGLADGAVHLPFFAPLQLTYNELWDAFIANFYIYNNWHLFWFILPIAFCATLWHWKNNPHHQTQSLIIALPLLAIFSIFLFSAHGMWAENYTALNRLFLHFIPIWIFILFSIWLDATRDQPQTARTQPRGCAP